MTRYAPLWQQAGSYAASLDRLLMQTLWPSGGLNGGACSSVANTANVNVTAGFCAVVLQAGQGVALCRWDATEVVAITTPLPPSGQSRIDLIVVSVRDNALDGGANNDFIVTSVPGTAAASPLPPALPTNSFLLATLTIPGAQANLNTSTLTTRAPGLVPGGPTPAGRLYNPSQTSGFASGTQVLPMGSTAYVRGGCIVQSGGIVVPLPGVYMCAVQVNLTAIPSGVSATGYLLQNGTAMARGSACTIAPPVPMVIAAEPHLLAAGDLIQAGLNFNGAAGTSATAGTSADLNYLSVAYLGP